MTRLPLTSRKAPLHTALVAAMLAAGFSAAAVTAAGQQVAPGSAARSAGNSAQGGKPATQEQAKADANKLPAERGDVVDRIVAIVNGDLVLESDIDEEERFTKLYPYETEQGKSLRDQALNRLIDRALILQQQGGVPLAPVTDEQVNKEEADLRKDLPACAHTDCASDAGWKEFITKAGFTEDELKDRLRLREQVLHFIEQRFRSAVRITDKQIEEFYTNTMLPEYARQKATAPPLDSVRDRIQELLLQQEVTSMLDQWLKTLRDSGHVRLLQRGVEAP